MNKSGTFFSALRQSRRRLLTLFLPVAALFVIGGLVVKGRHEMSAGIPEASGGILRLAGLTGDVDIVRDSHGVPHIFTRNADDAYFAMGFVHAQDRLWEMEGMRRLVAGHLAEIAGPQALPSDRLMRTLGLWQAASASYNDLLPQTKAALNAYAAGVNAWIFKSNGNLPAEFKLLGLKPEPWRPADSLAIGKLMAWQLSGNYREELLRAVLKTRLTAPQIDVLLPKMFNPPGASHDHRKSGDAGVPAAEAARLLAALPETGPHSASNAWVLGGRLTTTHAPILANDPHLQMSAPILWYLARVVTPEHDLAGATIPGLPFHILGQNGKIAWGMTTTGADTQDLFEETPDPSAPQDHYLAPGQKSTPFETRQETIRVKGADDVRLIVRSTGHGPIISDLLSASITKATGQKLLALSFTGLRIDDRTADALYLLDRANTPDDIRQALRFWMAPVQNVVFADHLGNTGFFVAGLVPQRRSGDGTEPSDGATEDDEWIGVVPADKLPYQINPQQGWFANTNNSIITSDYPYFLTTAFEDDLRYARITKLISDQTKSSNPISPDLSASWQMDIVDPGWDRLKPLLLPQIQDDPASGPAGEEARALLQKWDGAASGDQPQPLIFATWLAKLSDNLYNSALGDQAPYFTRNQTATIENILEYADVWCGDSDPGCAKRIKASWEQTIATLTQRYGSSVAGHWLWSRAHKTSMQNQVWRSIPLIGRIADLSVPASGDENTLNRGGYREHASGDSPEDMFGDDHGPGYRAVYDLAAPDRSRFVIATGESGQILSPHYSDLQPLWSKGDGVALAGLMGKIERENGSGHWILQAPVTPITFNGAAGKKIAPPGESANPAQNPARETKPASGNGSRNISKGFGPDPRPRKQEPRPPQE